MMSFALKMMDFAQEVAQNAATSRTNVLMVQQSVVLDPYMQMLEVKVVLEGTTFTTLGRHAIQAAVETALCGEGACATQIVGEPAYLPMTYIPPTTSGRRQLQSAGNALNATGMVSREESTSASWSEGSWSGEFFAKMLPCLVLVDRR